MNREEDCILVKVLKDQTNQDLTEAFKKKHLDTIQNIPIRLIDSTKKAYDHNIDDKIICSIPHYKYLYKVECTVLDNSINKVKPGLISKSNENLKRPASNHDGINIQSKKSNLNISKSNENNIQESQTLNDSYSIDNLLKLADQNEFPKKEFTFGNKKSYYTPKLHFFDCETVFAQRPVTNISLSVRNAKR